MRTAIFFIVIIAALMYLKFFWRNRNQKVTVQLFQQKTDMSLGMLLLAVFLDGAIITALLIWLLS